MPCSEYHWKLVKYIPNNMSGFDLAKDLLSGKEVYGLKNDIEKAWSVKFDGTEYDKFKFESLD